MSALRRAVKCALMLLAAGAMVTALPALSNAETGVIRIAITKVGFIVGVGGGSGSLQFKGRTYPLSIGGVSVGTFGATTADMIGVVHNLRAPEDIAGTYSAASAGVAVAGGVKAIKLHNSNGAILELRGKQVGLEFSIDLSGMQIALR